MDNILQSKLENAVKVFGSKTIHEVFDYAKSVELKTLYEVYNELNMKRHAECLDFLFFDELNNGENV